MRRQLQLRSGKGCLDIVGVQGNRLVNIGQRVRHVSLLPIRQGPDTRVVAILRIQLDGAREVRDGAIEITPRRGCRPTRGQACSIELGLVIAGLRAR